MNLIKKMKIIIIKWIEKFIDIFLLYVQFNKI